MAPMRCATCRESQSKQIPVSNVCRHCHYYSHYVSKEKRFALDTYPVTLYLHEYCDGERYVSSNENEAGTLVVAAKEFEVCIEVGP